MVVRVQTNTSPAVIGALSGKTKPFGKKDEFLLEPLNKPSPSE